MAVYTHLSDERLAQIVEAYDVGAMVSAEAIAEGISNSNWMIETTGRDGGGGRYVLTMYERRIERVDLPFFLGLLDHLAAKGCAVPATVHDRCGAPFRVVDGKAVALIEHLPGSSPARPTPAQAHSAGMALGRVHLAALDFPHQRADPLTPAHSADVLKELGSERLAEIDPDLVRMIDSAQELADRFPSDLPGSIVHSDLFPDNVLMVGDTVTGLIDFYFACNGAMAYDLAVAHAAWAFDQEGETFDAEVAHALAEGYEKARPLAEEEVRQLPILAQAACLRFVVSRVEDWLDPPRDALVRRKNPIDFVRRLDFYRDAGKSAFR